MSELVTIVLILVFIIVGCISFCSIAGCMVKLLPAKISAPIITVYGSINSCLSLIAFAIFLAIVISVGIINAGSAAAFPSVQDLQVTYYDASALPVVTVKYNTSFVLKNSVPLTVEVSNIELDIFVQDNKVATGMKIPTNVTMGVFATTPTITVTGVEVSMSAMKSVASLPDVVKALVFGTAQVTVSLKGSCLVKALFLNNVPFVIDMQLQVPLTRADVTKFFT